MYTLEHDFKHYNIEFISIPVVLKLNVGDVLQLSQQYHMQTWLSVAITPF